MVRVMGWVTLAAQGAALLYAANARSGRVPALVRRLARLP